MSGQRHDGHVTAAGFEPANLCGGLIPVQHWHLTIHENQVVALRLPVGDRRAAVGEGLPLMEVMSLHYNGKSFTDSSCEERVAVLTVLSHNEHMTDLPEVRFFRTLKSLTIEGYYTSKIGIHDELEYKGNRILTQYVGCDDPTPKSS